MATDWLLVATAVLLLVHLLVVAHALRRSVGGRDRTASVSDAPRPVENDGDCGQVEDGVHCPACGVANEAGYRYCRQCVSELPTGISFVENSQSSRSRRTL
jgi:hypothetical protein